MKTVLLLSLATANALDCSMLMEKLCGDVPIGDVPAAVSCLETNNLELTSAGCRLPEEALSLLKMAVDSPQELAEGLRKSEIAAVVTLENLGPALTDFAMIQDDTKLPTVFVSF